MNRFFKILGTLLGAKANNTLSQEQFEAINDAAIIEKFAECPTQLTRLDELDNVIENIALELNNVSTKLARQKALLNRLDRMLQTIAQYQDKVPILSSTLSTIVLKKLSYLERHSDSLCSDDLLDWLNNTQSLIQLGHYVKQVDRIRKKALSKKLNTIAPNEGLLWFQQRVDIENMNLVEVNIFLDWYNKKAIPQAKEIVQLGKQKILDKIHQETTSDAMALMRRYPWLEKLLLQGQTINLVGKGKSGIVVESAKSNTVIKIYHSGDTENILQEVKTHLVFRDAIRLGKLARTVDGKPPIPDWLEVPNLYQIPNLTATEVSRRTYIMDRIAGITLKRWVYLKLDAYRSKLEPFTDQEILALSEIEFEALLEKRNLLHYFVYRTSALKVKNELLPEVFLKAFENDIEKTTGLQQALAYLRDEHQLVHPDFQWKNILIGDHREIYLIDFAP
ncbi:MAG TPA: hypothetical protein DCM38_08685 [Gammaproteobacteria bacterium]|nr:hypothetical protein [Gammaproteobacteria bacterium]